MTKIKKIKGTPEQQLKRRELVDALRSGKYEQGIGKLKRLNGGMCCLGVACDISGLGEWVPTSSGDWYVFTITIKLDDVVCDSSYLPTPIMDLFGFDHHGEFAEDQDAPEAIKATADSTTPDWQLAQLNDMGWTFAQIADLIEKRWEVAPAT